MESTKKESGCPYAKAFMAAEPESPSQIHNGGCPIGQESYIPGSMNSKKKNIEPLYYSDYLGVHQMIELQKLRSEEYGDFQAHDEMLFIVIHQTYELWFRQILFELDSVRRMMDGGIVPQEKLSTCCARLNRCVEILKILVDQVRILETMQPVDFLEFRDYLSPASGFQSMQFRLMEIRLGLKSEHRYQYQQASYLTKFDERDRSILEKAEAEVSIFQLVESWLEKLPCLTQGTYSFWDAYKASVEHMLDSDTKAILENKDVDEEERQKQLKELAQTKENFDSLFDEEKHEDLKSRGLRKLSMKAMQNALLVQIYKDIPILHLPHRLLSLLVDIDELITTWRFRHTTMVHRMIGTKIGTGGSSGYHYLRSTTSDRYKVFVDLFNLSTFLIPREVMPDIPQYVRSRMDFPSSLPSSPVANGKMNGHAGHY